MSVRFMSKWTDILLVPSKVAKHAKWIDILLAPSKVAKHASPNAYALLYYDVKI